MPIQGRLQFKKHCLANLNTLMRSCLGTKKLASTEVETQKGSSVACSSILLDWSGLKMDKYGYPQHLTNYQRAGTLHLSERQLGLKLEKLEQVAQRCCCGARTLTIVEVKHALKVQS